MATTTVMVPDNDDDGEQHPPLRPDNTEDEEEIQYAQENHYHERSKVKHHLHLATRAEKRARYVPSIVYLPLLVVQRVLHPFMLLGEHVRNLWGSGEPQQLHRHHHSDEELHQHPHGRFVEEEKTSAST